MGHISGFFIQLFFFCICEIYRIKIKLYLTSPCSFFIAKQSLTPAPPPCIILRYPSSGYSVPSCEGLSCYIIQKAWLWPYQMLCMESAKFLAQYEKNKNSRHIVATTKILIFFNLSLPNSTYVLFQWQSNSQSFPRSVRHMAMSSKNWFGPVKGYS